MRISDWSSDVCFFRSGCDGFDPGNLLRNGVHVRHFESGRTRPAAAAPKALAWADLQDVGAKAADLFLYGGGCAVAQGHHGNDSGHADDDRSEEHTSELQSLMRISYAVFCLKKK